MRQIIFLFIALFPILAIASGQKTIPAHLDYYFDLNYLNSLATTQKIKGNAAQEPELKIYLSRFWKLASESPLTHSLSHLKSPAAITTLLNAIQLDFLTTEVVVQKRLDENGHLRLAINRAEWFSLSPQMREQVTFRALSQLILGRRLISHPLPAKHKMSPLRVLNAEEELSEVDYVKHRPEHLRVLTLFPHGAPLPNTFLRLPVDFSTIGTDWPMRVAITHAASLLVQGVLFLPLVCIETLGLSLFLLLMTATLAWPIASHLSARMDAPSKD